ncbi:MAG: TIGR04086 family membrane protein [Clostridia bacterium]|nr:TIGR04086 family membrane protein [Clostridia bacterium]
MKNKENFVLDLKDTIRGVLLSLLFSLLLVLVFALIIRWADLDEKTIIPVNYAIKFLSLFLGVMIGFKNRKNGILKGAIVGLIFILLTFLIFSAMNGFKDVKFNWLDLAFSPLGGAIIGVIRVNLPERRK